MIKLLLNENCDKPTSGYKLSEFFETAKLFFQPFVSQSKFYKTVFQIDESEKEESVNSIDKHNFLFEGVHYIMRLITMKAISEKSNKKSIYELLTMIFGNPFYVDSLFSGEEGDYYTVCSEDIELLFDEILKQNIDDNKDLHLP
ncbi:MAG: hypothetical protein J6D10_09805, partial [Clostridia bacterium]|nr:hypothetical protein [Clostridia bacterium]